MARQECRQGPAGLGTLYHRAFQQTRPEPVYFRYAWARNPLETLKSSDLSNLPFDTQRNDSFTLADLYEIYTARNPRSQDAESR